MSVDATVYTGSCHCGAIAFDYRTSQSPDRWRVRACQCSFCRAHSALSTSDPSSTIAFRECQAGLLQRYRFGLRTADFLLCRACGVYIGAEIQTMTGRFGIINVNALRPIPQLLAPAVSMEYGSEAIEERISRRETRWSPVVALGSLAGDT
jgi:hypothetical protein